MEPMNHKVSANTMSNNVDMQSDRAIETLDRAPEYNVTNLPNGFTVLTESQTFPGTVQMGKSSDSVFVFLY